MSLPQGEGIDAIPADRAGVWALQHHQRPGESGFAATGFADEAEGLATGEIEVDPVEGAQAGLPVLTGGHLERLGEIPDFENLRFLGDLG